jgi:hypothetical protein
LLPTAEQIEAMSQEKRNRLSMAAAGQIVEYSRLLGGMADGIEEKAELEERIIGLYQLRSQLKD